MWQSIIFHLALCSLFLSVVSSSESPVKGEVQSCSGCQLNRNPEVKTFIYEDLPKYDDVVFKSIYGAPPELVLFSDEHEELERIPLIGHTRSELNQLFLDKGFKLKENLRPEL